MLGAFFDDSGTHPTSPAVVIGGLLGTEEQWDEFAEAWTALLAAPLPGKPPLSQFHLSPCRAQRGEFAAYNEAERDHITYLFRQIILDVGLVTIAVSVNREAWNELVTADLSNELGHPEELCFVKCLELMMNTIRFRKPGQPVTVFFDQGVEKRLKPWVDLYMSQTDKFPELSSILFAPVQQVVALQGADMIATETYQYTKLWLKDRENAVPNNHFRDFIKRELSTGIVFDREQIAEMVERVRTGKKK